ncbi:MAG: hypothetical protein IPN81_10375 [Nitrosomonadales bacterium]|nr:hypothetical protein [Nitrosomonadales bacterium]
MQVQLLQKSASIVRAEDNNLLSSEDNDALMVATWDNNLEMQGVLLNKGRFKYP